MRGGHGHRKFFLSETNRIETEFKKNLPPSKYSAEEIQAGFDKLSGAYGFYGTLLFMEKETPYNRDELERWSVKRFKGNVLYLALWSHARRLKDEALEAKRKRT